jgi:hypothetical protein
MAATVPYADLDDVIDLGSMPEADIVKANTNRPTRIPKLILAISDRINSYLRVRYSTPLVTPFPPAIVWAVVKIVIWELYLVRGISPTAAVVKEIKEQHDLAQKWIDDLRTLTARLDREADQTPNKSEGGPVLGSMTPAKEVLYGFLGSNPCKKGC